ncbi:MAG TPA: GNAT family N-acetyltransferase [Gaiellaceae bacterium]
MVLEIRVAASGELEQAVAVNNAVWTDDPETVETVREATEWMRAAEHFLAVEGDAVVGAGFAGILPHRPELTARLMVPQPHRRRGVGTALYRATSRWAHTHGFETMAGWVPEADPDGLGWASRRGFEEVGRERLLGLELRGDEAPAVEFPGGVELATLAERPDLLPSLYDVICEAWPDVPGEADSVVEPFDEWRHSHMEGTGDDPRAVFVAVSDGEAVGYAKLMLPVVEGGPVWNDITAVRRSWRGRGIAGALKAAEVRWAAASGYRLLLTRNEERNAPIRRLNERFGYVDRPGRIRVRGPLATVAP